MYIYICVCLFPFSNQNCRLASIYTHTATWSALFPLFSWGGPSWASVKCGALNVHSQALSHPTSLKRKGKEKRGGSIVIELKKKKKEQRSRSLILHANVTAFLSFFFFSCRALCLLSRSLIVQEAEFFFFFFYVPFSFSLKLLFCVRRQERSETWDIFFLFFFPSHVFFF